MNLQLTILSKLRGVHPRMLPMETLWAETHMSMVPKPGRSEFNQALRVLEDEHKQIIVIKNADTERVKITADGIARHEEALS
jgi:hypothetical protein